MSQSNMNMNAEQDLKNHRYCVIMCGGVGSRFWPFSRSGMPKQFLDFFGTGRSLLQLTYDRMLPITDPDHTILVTNSAYYDIIRQQLPDVKESNILLEPAPQHRPLRLLGCPSYLCHRPAGLDRDSPIRPSYPPRSRVPSDHPSWPRFRRAS